MDLPDAVLQGLEILDQVHESGIEQVFNVNGEQLHGKVVARRDLKVGV
jgi:hypothetical protein